MFHVGATDTTSRYSQFTATVSTRSTSGHLAELKKKLVKNVAMQPTVNIAKKIEPLMAEQEVKTN
jgi:hypothetical protein